MRARILHSARLVLLISLTAIMVLTLPACSQPNGSQWTLGNPKLFAPVIKTEGVLRVGVNSSHAPFAGIYNSKLVGMDVDIAAALADQLGLRLELVDVSGKDTLSLFYNGDIDILLGFQPEDIALSPYSLVGPYIFNGPAIFGKTSSQLAATFDPDLLYGQKIAAQDQSLSASQSTDRYGSEYVQTFSSMDEVFGSLVNGSINYVAADAVIGSYHCVRYDSIACLGFLNEGGGVYIAVAPNNPELTDAMVIVLRSLRENGVLELIINKWLGPSTAELIINRNAIIGSEGTGGGIDLGDDLPDPSNANSSGDAGDGQGL